MASPFVKIGFKDMILSVLISSIALSAISFMSIEKSFAQTDDDSDSKVIGQKGNGNDASQSDETSQETEQSSMCVSGEITSLSCNNLSGQGIGASVPGELGTTSIAGKIYEVIGPSSQSTFSTTSDASCSSGDSVISGGFKSGFVGDDYVNTDRDLDSFMLDGDTWRVHMSDRGGVAELKATAYAYCFDNP